MEVSDQLDSQLDFATLELSSVGFGDHWIAIPPGIQQFSTVVEVAQDGQHFQVHIHVGFNPVSGELTASFQSIDAATMLPPNVLTGFLPPEDGSGRGQGHVSYTIRARTDLNTGDQVRNIALITFDNQQSIATNQIDPLDPSQGTDPALEALNTMDVGDPSSVVHALPPVVNTNDIEISWSGQDDAGGSGIASYSIFVSDNGGPYQPWLESTVETSSTFTGQHGHTYGFFSIAVDNVGHAEVAPASADTETTVATSPWQNVRDVFDVDDDTFVVPLDALLIINDLNRSGARDLPVPPDPLFAPPPYLDVSGNNSVEPLDALLVINELNRRTQGEGEAGAGMLLAPTRASVRVSMIWTPPA